MFIPGSNAANTNLPLTMNNNLHQQAFLFDNLSKFSSECRQREIHQPKSKCLIEIDCKKDFRQE